MKPGAYARDNENVLPLLVLGSGSISYQKSETPRASDLREVAKQTYLESFWIKLLEQQSITLTNGKTVYDSNNFTE